MVGGILTGRDLIKAAELRSVISDVEKFKTAVNTFRGQYDCLPGDCSNASTLFGAATNCAGGMLWPIASGTCNGNGNGKIEVFDPSPAAPAPAAVTWHDESVLFWQQLSLAKLVQGNYDGANMWLSGEAGGALASLPDVNVPSSRIQGGCYSMAFSSGTGFIGPIMYADPAANMFTLGNPIVNQWGSLGRNWCEGGIMTANEALSIDQKIDDGLPYSGTVQVPLYNFPFSTGVITANVCTTGSAPYTYMMNSGRADCMLGFVAGF